MTRKRGSEREEAARELELYRTGKWAFEGTPEETAEHFAELERLAREGSTEPPPMSLEEAGRLAARAGDPEVFATRAAKIHAVAAAFDIPMETDADRQPLYRALDGYRQYREVGDRGPIDMDDIRNAGLYTGKRGLYKPTRDLIEQADDILVRYYVGHGFPLTVRQLFYKMVTQNILRNTPGDYRKIQDLAKNARYWGMISWDMLIDRGRTVMEFETYADEADALDNLGQRFAVRLWADQPTRVEVWVEKDAAIGTIEAVCRDYQIPWSSTRGYNSASGAYSAAERIIGMLAEGQNVLILHIADHDPSGVDMSRDLTERLAEFVEADMRWNERAVSWEIRRIALTQPQVGTLVPRGTDGKPLSQPVKETDTRTPEYKRRFGGRCWELDAIEPTDLARIIEEPVLEVIDRGRWAAARARTGQGRENFGLVGGQWRSVVESLNGTGGWERN